VSGFSFRVDFAGTRKGAFIFGGDDSRKGDFFFLEGHAAATEATGDCAALGEVCEDAAQLRGLEDSYAAVHVGSHLRSDPESMASRRYC
jgi:hypothetical protein